MRRYVVITSVLLGLMLPVEALAYSYADMDAYLRRMLPMRNTKGAQATRFELRYRVRRRRNDVWDCNDRAEVASQIIEKELGVKPHEAICKKDGVWHRYLVVMDNGEIHEFLK